MPEPMHPHTAPFPHARRALLHRSLALAAGLAGFPAVRPQAATEPPRGFPAKPLRIVCPYPAGATTDAISRLMAQGLQTTAGVSAMVDNRAGAGGNIGTEAVARGEADGHTLLLGALGPLAANAALYPRLGYDPARDFTPLAWATSVPLVLVAHPGFAATGLAQALALLRSQPDRHAFASAGNGTPQHLAGALFQREAGVRLVHVPYRGSAPALTDVMAGTVPLLFDAAPAVLPHIQGGRLRALAVTSAARMPALPQVLTLTEAGVSAEISGWYGFLAPAATPPDRTAWLSAQMARVLAQPATQQRLSELGSVRVDSSAQAFARLIADERTRWQRLIREAAIRID